MTIVDHLESFLGKVDKGWSDTDESDGLQIVSFPDSPDEGLITFATLGLSQHVLGIHGSKRVRQELVYVTYNSTSPEKVASFLTSLGETILKKHKALLRGEVVHLSGDTSSKMGFESVYCTIPVLFDDDFATYHGTEPPTVLVWVFPLRQEESDFISNHGWENFEDMLEAQNTDLLDLNRPRIEEFAVFQGESKREPRN